MSITTVTNGLCSVDDVKSALNLTSSDNVDDLRLIPAVAAASRLIETYCGRRFWQDDAPSDRIFQAQTNFVCEVDDISTTDGLVISTDYAGDGSFGTTFADTDYDLDPLNMMRDGQPWPGTKLTAIRTLLFPIFAGSSYLVPRPLVRVTAQWGWAAVPDPVQQAAVLQAISIYKAADAPFGATGFNEVGVIRLKQALHPTAAMLLTDYVKADGTGSVYC